MDAIALLIADSAGKVWISFTHNWIYLLISVFIATGLKLFTDQQKITGFLVKNKRSGVITATAAAVGTPLCSCGTTAVVLGMMASMIPWAPIVAFMVASPLSSPEGIVYSAGLFGWPFAIYYFIVSIILGLAGGALADFFEKQGWLKNQTRMIDRSGSNSLNHKPVSAPIKMQITQDLAFAGSSSCDCSPVTTVTNEDAGVYRPQASNSCSCNNNQLTVNTTAGSGVSSCQCGESNSNAGKKPVTVAGFLIELWIASRTLLIMFAGFAFIGFFLNGLIPEEWVRTLFGSGNYYSVPLAATFGLPFYISSEGSLPLIASLIQGGMNPGAAMAFLVTGAGTSLGAVTGMLTIARWRVVALVVGTLLIGSIIAGYGFNLMMSLI